MNTDKQLVITMVGENNYHIQWRDKQFTGLCWHEMLSYVIYMTCDRTGPAWNYDKFPSQPLNTICACGKNKPPDAEQCVECRLAKDARATGTCKVCGQPIWQTAMGTLWSHEDANLNLKHFAEPLLVERGGSK